MAANVRLSPSMSAYVLSFLDSMRQANIDGRDTPEPGRDTLDATPLKLFCNKFNLVHILLMTKQDHSYTDMTGSNGYWFLFDYSEEIALAQLD